QLRQVAALLLGGAVAADLVDAQVRVRAVGEPDRGRAARDLLHGDAMRQIAEPRAAELLLDRDPVQAERAHARPQVARKNVAAVDLGGARRDLVGREAAHGVAQRVDLLAEVEVEAAPGIGDHGVPLTRGIVDRRVGKAKRSGACPRVGTARSAPLPTLRLLAIRPNHAVALRAASPPKIIRSIAARGAGLANRKPCISSQPARRSKMRCSSVSTPSHSTVRPSARPSAMIAWMITPPSAERPSGATNSLSILSLSIGKRRR